MTDKNTNFKSLKQAWWLYNKKPKTFRHIAGKYGVPDGWHKYKKTMGWFNNLKRGEEE